MPELARPNLDKLYRDAGLRNSHTKTKDKKYELTWAERFETTGDAKRELRAILLVPLIVIKESLKSAIEAVGDLLTAAVQLATLDGRGFDSLGNFFTNCATTVETLAIGIYDTIGSFVSLYMRTVATFLATVGSIFENEPTDLEEVVTDSNYKQYSAPAAANHSAYEAPQASAPSASYGQGTSQFSMFAAPKPTRSQALNNLAALQVDSVLRAQLAADIIKNTADYPDDTSSYTMR